jgi:hypothetical protein
VKKKKCFNCGYLNARDAAYCTLCYEPLNKPAGHAATQKPQAAAPAAPKPAPVYVSKLFLKLVLLTLLAAGAGTYIYMAARHTGSDGIPAAGSVNRFKEKTGAADKLLADYLAAKEALLVKISSGTVVAEGFGIAGEYTAELFRIEEDYAAAIKALELPRRSAVDMTADALYLEWEESHRNREAAAMEDFSVKYQQLAEIAAKGGS